MAIESLSEWTCCESGQFVPCQCENTLVPVHAKGQVFQVAPGRSQMKIQLQQNYLMFSESIQGIAKAHG